MEPTGLRTALASDHIENAPGEPPSNLFTIRPDGSGLRYHSFYDEDRYVMFKIHRDGSGLTRIRTFKVGFSGRDWGSQEG